MLIGDHERETVAGQLQEHCVAGRLTIEELEARLEQATTARTDVQLADALRDLPPTPSSQPVSQSPSAPPRMPGVRPFSEHLETDSTVTRARAAALTTIAPALNRSGFEMTEQTEHHLVFERRDSLVGPVIATVLIFPLGIVMLLARRRPQRIVVSLAAGTRQNTLITVHGRASRGVRRSIFQMRAET